MTDLIRSHRSLLLLSFVGGMIAILAFPPTASGDDAEALQQWGERYQAEIWPIIQARCIECHSGDEADGGFNADQFTSGDQVTAKMDVWENVAKRVRLKEMPPEGSPQLDDLQKAAFHRWVDSRPAQDLCSQLATDETQAWYRGFVMSRRLTRTEYLNAVRDAVGIDVDPSLPVPSDGSGGEGFDTNGATLYTSPIHIEQYLVVASETIGRVLSAATTAPASQADPMPTEIAARAAADRLLGSIPTSQSQEHEWADRVIRQFAHRAWRRPVADTEVTRLLELFDAAKSRGDETLVALSQPLQAILISPNFLFVVESETEVGGVQRLSPHELAMRLSLFIWSSIPDDELLALADENGLQSPAAVTEQVHRMLDDPKSLALGENFGLQWLSLANFSSTAKPDGDLYPQFTPELSRDFREEAIRTVAGVFQDNRSLLELIDTDSIYVNGRLAEHYGVVVPDGLKGNAANQWHRVTINDRRRGGVMTLGASLVSTSYPRRTSPVLRGRWILEGILGSRVPPPPPNVPALEEHVADRPMSLRERLELHRTNPECASCHNRMDPLGFGLENFDVLARWRESDSDVPIDASGKLPSGESFDGPIELKQLVLTRSNEFEKNFVRKMVGFALGRELNKFDDCVIEDCLKQLNHHGHQSRWVIETIANSYPFQHRYFKATTKP